MTQTEDLVSDSIKEVFRNYLEEKGVQIVNIEIKPGSIKGDNYLGIIAKAEVTGTDQNGKPVDQSFIIKSAPKSEGLRKFAPICLAYEREIFMYNTVLPTFVKFQEEKKIKHPFLSFAKCLKTSSEDKNEALIMEDMKAHGYQLQNRKKALDYATVKLVITEIARYHAISFAVRDQKPELFQQIGDKIERNYMTEMNMETFDQHIDVQCNKAKNTLDPVKDKDAIEKFEFFKNNYLEDMTTILDDHCHPYSVIRHGDCWTNNFLFLYNDKNNPKTPTKVCFLDWQLSHIGPPVLDLLYFIYASTDKKLRDEHFDNLLKLYYSTLKQFGAELGSDIEKLYPYDILMEQMKSYGRYGLIIAIMLLPLLTSDSEEIPDINQVFENVDEDKVMEAFTFESKNVEEFNVRVRDIIHHMVEKKYI